MKRTSFRSPALRTVLGSMALCLAVGALSLSLAAQRAPIKGLGKNYQLSARPSTGGSQRVEFTLDRYTVDTVDEGGNTYSRVNCQGGVNSNQKGYAELPFFHATLQVANAQKYHLVIMDESHTDIVLDHPMLPSKGVIYRNEDPSKIERVIDPESLKGGWFPVAAADIADPFIFRDVRGVNVYLRPFQYDAATRTLRVYTRMVVSVEPEGELRSREFTASRKIVSEMKPVYQSLFLNSPSRSAERWAHEVGEVGDMLVICTGRDAEAIQPYVQWKREKGHQVKVVQVIPGTNVKTLIQEEYEANPDLLYVQLVGDWMDVQSDHGTYEDKPMDPTLGCVVGDDPYAELIIGRFSANTADQVTTQVNKAIYYEKNPDVSGTWYKKGLVISSSDAHLGDDAEDDKQHLIYIRENRLLRTTYSEVAEALGTESTKNMISDPINQGLGLINYNGHGRPDAWVTANFNNTEVSRLTNGNQLPVICSVSCYTGTFQENCLAEAWLRNPCGGAVVGMFSTIAQSWDPPMRGQDYFNDLLTGGYDYAALPGDGTSTTYGRSTFGSLAVNAAVLMYAESGDLDDEETIQTWTTFGDASLQVRTDIPRTIALSNETVYPGSTFSTQVTADGVGVSKALVTLSRGEHVFSGLTDDSGNITLNHELNAGAAKLVVTGQNTTTISRDITIGTPNEDVTVTVNANTAVVYLGEKYQFHASVTGTTNTAVTWTCTGDGIVSSSGLFTAPSHAGVYTVTATSVVDTTRFATATVTVTPKPGVSIELYPKKIEIAAGATKQLFPGVNGTTNQEVTWTCSPGGGKVSSKSLYTAPSKAGHYTVTAISKADPSKSATVDVTVTIPMSITISPYQPTIPCGTRQQFTATITGSTDTAVTWSCSEEGTITPTGLYTAPSTITDFPWVKATSVADPSRWKKMDVILTFNNPDLRISLYPTTVTISPNTTVYLAASVTGSQFTPRVKWSVTPNAQNVKLDGISSGDKKLCEFQTDTPGIYTVTAISEEDLSKTVTATINVVPDSGSSTFNEFGYNDDDYVCNVVPDTISTITGAMDSDNDLDYFDLVVAAGRTLIVNMTATSGSDLDLTLMDSDGHVLKCSGGSTSTEKITYVNSNTEPTHYLVKVSQKSGFSGTPAYKLSVSR